MQGKVVSSMANARRYHCIPIQVLTQVNNDLNQFSPLLRNPNPAVTLDNYDNFILRGLLYRIWRRNLAECDCCSGSR